MCWRLKTCLQVSEQYQENDFTHVDKVYIYVIVNIYTFLEKYLRNNS